MADWATGAPLFGMTQAWSTLIESLAGQVASFGASLTKAFNGYAATDSAAAARTSTAAPVSRRARNRYQDERDTKTGGARHGL